MCQRKSRFGKKPTYGALTSFDKILHEYFYFGLHFSRGPAAIVPAGLKISYTK